MADQLRKHLTTSYGTSPAVWGGILLTAASHILLKIAVPIWIADWLASAAFESGNPYRVVVELAGLFLAALLLGGAGDYIFVKRTDARYENLVSQFHDQIMNIDVSYFRNEKAGVLASLFRDYMDGTINIFRVFRTEVVPLFISSVPPIVVLAFYDWRFAGVFAAAVVLRSLLSLAGFPKVQALRRKALEVYQQLSGIMSDQMAHVGMVRVSADIKRSKVEVVTLARGEGRLFWARHRLATTFEFAANAVAAACFVLIFWLIAAGSLNTQESLSVAVLSVFFIIQGMQAAQSAGELYQRLGEHVTRVRLALGTLGAALLGQRWVAEDASPIPNSGSMEFRGVGFSYGTSSASNVVLGNIDLRIPAGRHFAVVGANGAGKSTLANLLLRFDDVSRGCVLIGGHDVRDLSISALYRSLSYVPQEPKLLNATLAANLFFLEPAPGGDRVRAVAEIVGLDEVVASLPEGLDTSVGEMGSKLSGGQRQRVAIARSLLRDANLYIFDEATSAIEPEDAGEIIRRSRELLIGKTFMVITHSPEIPGLFSHVLRVEHGDMHWVVSP